MRYLATILCLLFFVAGCTAADDAAYETGRAVGKVTSLPEKVTEGMADSQIEERDKAKHDPFGRDDQ